MGFIYIYIYIYIHTHRDTHTHYIIPIYAMYRTVVRIPASFLALTLKRVGRHSVYAYTNGDSNAIGKCITVTLNYDSRQELLSFTINVININLTECGFMCSYDVQAG